MTRMQGHCLLGFVLQFPGGEIFEVETLWFFWVNWDMRIIGDGVEIPEETEEWMKAGDSVPSW